MDRTTITILLLLFAAPSCAGLVSYVLSTKTWSKRNQAYWNGCVLGGTMVIGWSYANFYNLAHSNWTNHHPNSFWFVYISAELLTFLMMFCFGTAIWLKNGLWMTMGAILVPAFLAIFINCFY
jgi:hypothetical protein